MNRKIKQLKASEVLEAIVNDKRVIRVNLNTAGACDISGKSVNVIKKDLEKDSFIYIVEVGEND